MRSSLFCCKPKQASKKKTADKKYTSAGTGYGGSSVLDRKNLEKGRQKVCLQESARRAQQLRFLIVQAAQLKQTSTSSSTPSSSSLQNDDTDKDEVELISTLKDVFATILPNEWTNKENKKLLLVALTCLGLFVDKHDTSPTRLTATAATNGADLESLATVFFSFAQHAHFLQTHAYGNHTTRMTTAAATTSAAAHYRPRLPHERLVEKILQVEAKLKERCGMHHHQQQQQQQASQTINGGITLDHSSASTVVASPPS